MGQGMIIITPKTEEVIKIAGNYCIKAKYIGEVVKDRRIIIKNKGVMANYQNKELIFECENSSQ